MEDDVENRLKDDNVAEKGSFGRLLLLLNMLLLIIFVLVVLLSHPREDPNQSKVRHMHPQMDRPKKYNSVRRVPKTSEWMQGNRCRKRTKGEDVAHYHMNLRETALVETLFCAILLIAK